LGEDLPACEVGVFRDELAVVVVVPDVPVNDNLDVDLKPGG
jgi:hypothetical protein